MAGNKKSKKQKQNAKWDPFSTKILIEVCMDEIRSSGKPGIAFSDERWEVVANHFNTRASKKYTPNQLKDRMESLRTDWLIWKVLVGRERGVGWNHPTGAIQADATRWEAKIRDNPNYAKFQHQGLEFRDDLDFIFDDTVAPSQNALKPVTRAPIESSGRNTASDVPLEIIQPDDGEFNLDDEYSPMENTNHKRKEVAIQDIGARGTKGKPKVGTTTDLIKTSKLFGRNTASDVPLDNIQPDDGEFNLDDELSPMENTPKERVTIQDTGAKVTKGQQKVGTAADLRKSLERLVEATESPNKTKKEEIAATSEVHDVHGQYSIPECVEVLKSIKGVYLNSRQFSFAVELLKDSQNRVILMSMEDSVDALVDWILYKYERSS